MQVSPYNLTEAQPVKKALYDSSNRRSFPSSMNKILYLVYIRMAMARRFCSSEEKLRAYWLTQASYKRYGHAAKLG